MKHLDLTPDEFRSLAARQQTEAQLQRQVVAELHLRGYLVLVTNAGVRRCVHCKKFPPSGKGAVASRGVPDLLIRLPSWPPWVWAGVELKRPHGGKISPEQRELNLGFHIVIEDSVKGVLWAISEVEESLKARQP